MTITSFYYLAFLAAGVVIYYVLPKAAQWVWLLLLSIVFYCAVATPFTIVFLVVSTLLAWGSTNLVERMRQKGAAGRRMLLPVSLAVCANILLWLALKGQELVAGIWGALGAVIPQLPGLPDLRPFAALGMGYYTLQAIGYILDCYWETCRPQKNPFKLFLFIAFFPQLTTGPISRYGQLKTVYEKHMFQYTNITHGAQRILWGFFKKLVLAGRVGMIVDGIWADTVNYYGLYIWVAILLYPVQMYADFSGCMDIVIGTAELFDIKLLENFKNPFFSKTSQEFWQRWHITLGAWAKDYVLYPVLKSRAVRGLANLSKKRFGKKAGKFISTAAGMLVLWLVMGVWHGAYKYVIGVSLWYWVILMLGELTAPLLSRLTEFLHIRTESFSWNLFRMVRTYLIYAVGAVFFRAGEIREALSILVEAARGLRSARNPWIFFNYSVLELDVSHMDLNIIIVSVILLLIVAVLREKYGYARTWMEQQGIVFRWAVWLSLFLFVLIYGWYGPLFDASIFIYQGF